MELRRLISEPTAAALAYGLDKKKGVEYIVVIDLGNLFLLLVSCFSRAIFQELINLKLLVDIKR